MSKVYVKKHKTELHLLNVISYPENVNERLLVSISKQLYPYLLPLVSNNEKKKPILDCNITGLTSLKSFAENAASKKSFLHIVQQIIAVVRACEEKMLNVSNLCLDCNYIFTDRTKDALLFVYWPIVNNQNAVPLRVFFQSLPDTFHFDTYTDVSFLEAYKAYFDDIEPFSLNKFEKLIGTFSDNKATMHGKGTGPLERNDTAKKENTPSSGLQLEYDPFLGILNSTSEQADDIKKKLAVQEITEEKDTDRRVMKNDAFEPEQKKQKIRDEKKVSVHPFLIRVKNKEKIMITKTEFLIGKAKQGCDYRIEDNNAVSRNHAVIGIRDGHFYIKDLESTNKTYVNKKAVSPNTEIEITNHTPICLGNENFVFFTGKTK